MAGKRAVVGAIAAPAEEQLYSGMEGKALEAGLMEYPPMQEVLDSIPEHCFVKNTGKSLMYAAISCALTAACGVIAYAFLPLKLAYLPAWLAYAWVTGTVATGVWVAAHECGHGAFSDNKTLQDTVGYVLHSLLLVPYFSWQRSHAVHHARTNHIEEGETHVPMRATEADGAGALKLKEMLGDGPFALVNLVAVLGFGWPAYLLFGSSGGPVRGNTNHFWPWAGEQKRHSLFPGKWKNKVLQSDVGIFAVLAGLTAWAVKAGSVWPVLALYGGPYMVTNLWLVMYTWLQHSDVDVPHFGGKDWNLVKGSFMTIDRPYGALADFLHHRIGSTHVAHHINHTIPHYHAKEATEALQKKYPQFYLFDPTPIHEALWRIGSKCTVVRKQEETNFWLYSAH